MKSVTKAITILILVLLAVLFVTWRDAEYLLKQPLRLTSKQLIVVESGTSFSASVKQLDDRHFFETTRQSLYLKLFARMIGHANQIKAGEYELKPGMSSLDYLNLVVSGKGMLHELKIIEGWSFKQMMSAIQADTSLVHTLSSSDPISVMQALNEGSASPEGRFSPDTYLFSKDTTDVAFLRRAFLRMKMTLESEWENRQPDLPYTSPDEALIMASIIEKETGDASERPQIAGVFIRRLMIDMRLQTDPTVIYGMGDRYKGNLQRNDLLQDTPYNSYTRKGLPPTPICMPGRAALHAALHPSEGKALYFVARKNGTHQFSDTLDQHNRAVRQFQLKKSRKSK